MKFEHLKHSELPPLTETEKVRKVLSESVTSLATKLQHVMKIYQFTDGNATETDAPDKNRRRFMHTLAAGALAAATPNIARALDSIDPEWSKVQIAQKRLRKTGDPTLSLADFLCDSSIPNGAPHACFDSSGNRRSDPTGEPLIDIPRNQWYTEQSHTNTHTTDTTTSSAPENPLNSVTVEMPDGTTRTMTQKEFDNYINNTDTQQVPSTQDAQGSENSLGNSDTPDQKHKNASQSIEADSVIREPKLHELIKENLRDGSITLSRNFMRKLTRARFYEANHKHWDDAIARMKPHMPEIFAQFTKVGVPPDLAFLVVPESRFSNASSHMGARGHFQIMPQTARHYGYVPEDVSDVNVGANIAAQKLADDYKKYTGHDWDPTQYGRKNWRDGWMLTLASYNGGYVQKWFKQRGNRPGTYQEYLQWLQDDINNRIIPNEKSSMRNPDDVDELIAKLPMTLENLLYGPRVFAVADYGVIKNIPELMSAIRKMSGQ